MTTWITETEYRRSGGAYRTGLAINAAFLQEIKEDNVEFRTVFQDACTQLLDGEPPGPRAIADRLGHLHDELQTYFAVETFYGYFENAELVQQSVSCRAEKLLGEHETLSLELARIVEQAQQIVYGECGDEFTVGELLDSFREFAIHLRRHEEDEFKLIMRLFNEDLGEGD